MPELGGFKPGLSAAVANARRSADKGMPSGDTLPFEDSPAPLCDAADAGDRDAVASPTMPSTLIERYVKQLSELNGVISCCVFEVQSGKPDRPCRRQPGRRRAGAHGSTLLAAMMAASRGLGFGHALPEAAITLGAHHLLLRGVPRNPGLAMHAVLDKASANLTLARLQVLRMDALFDDAGKS